jgi:hypothetical protein
MLEEDLNDFIDTDDFAIEIEIVGGSETINGIFDAPYGRMDLLGMGVASESPKLTVKTEDIADQSIGVGTELKFNHPVTGDEMDYFVREIHDDGTGISELILSEDEEQ